MEKIILRDYSKSTLLTETILFFIVLYTIPLLGIKEKGLNATNLILLIVATVICIITILYFKRHEAYLVIEPTRITLFETKKLQKNAQKKWEYYFNECIQIELINTRRPIGKRNNIQDCIDIEITRSKTPIETINLNIYMDNNSRKKIESMISKHNIKNLKIR